MKKNNAIRIICIIALFGMLILDEDQVIDLSWICLGIWGVYKLYRGYIILKYKDSNIFNLTKITVIKRDEYLKYQGIRSIKISLLILISATIVIFVSLSPSIIFLKSIAQDLLLIIVIVTIFTTSITGALKLRNNGIISVIGKKYK